MIFNKVNVLVITLLLMIYAVSVTVSCDAVKISYTVKINP